MNIAVFFYSLVLRCYPRSYRAAFGRDMLQTFIDSYADTEAPGLLATSRFWLFMLGDEVSNIVRQHGATLVERYPLFHMSAPRLFFTAVCFIPAFMVCMAALISIALWLPLPPVSGVGFPLAMSTLVLLSAAISAFGSYTLICSLAWAVPARRVR